MLVLANNKSKRKFSIQCLVWVVVAVASLGFVTEASKWPNKIVTECRRILNFSSFFGSATNSPTPYDRIAGHPVFQLTTPWGSPYMNMEKLSDLEETIQTDDYRQGQTGAAPSSLSEEQNEFRTVALYYMDPDDALAMHGEMKQMDNMDDADIRILTSSLGKAIRQCSNLGNGLPTGMPPNPLDGNFVKEEGGSLRYKIIPPKRQLYYAARCIGKERVGLFGDATGMEDAITAVMGNSALEGMNLIKRREKRERKTPKNQSTKTKMQIDNAHMEGYCGIPVFYSPQLRKIQPIYKQLITGVHQETPLFFNYEDLELAWTKMKQKKSVQKGKNVPEKPIVEVFNLWDVLTSIEREQWIQDNKKTQQQKDQLVPKLTTTANNILLKKPVHAVSKRISILTTSKKDKEEERRKPDLDSIIFIPSSRSVQYKEAISARGNGKARLRPMQ